MIALRDNVKRFIESNTINKCDNLALRVAKLNFEVDIQGDKGKHKDIMLDALSKFEATDHLKESYGYAFRKWQSFMESRPDTECFHIKTETPVLLGTGNASVHEFGLNLNYPWGVPVISGSTLKGIVSSFLASEGGDAFKKSSDSPVKSLYQVELFGGIVEGRRKKLYIGSVVFNDGWMELPEDKTWFIPDIINVHHPKYYSGERLPDGTESPNPAKMAALKRGLTFFISLTGTERERTFIKKVLIQALEKKGLGGKTSVGYGRFSYVKSDDDIKKDRMDEVRKADIQALVKLSDKKECTTDSEIFRVFTQTVESLTHTKETSKLYRRFSPYSHLLHECEQGNIKTFHDVTRIFRELENSLDRFHQMNPDFDVRFTKTGQQLFDYVIHTIKIPLDQIDADPCLSMLKYTWDHVEISEDTVLDLFDQLETKTWLTKADFTQAVRSSDKISDDIKELILG